MTGAFFALESSLEMRKPYLLAIFVMSWSILTSPASVVLPGMGSVFYFENLLFLSLFLSENFLSLEYDF
jgi:hypothetical protein